MMSGHGGAAANFDSERNGHDGGGDRHPVEATHRARSVGPFDEDGREPEAQRAEDEGEVW